MDRSGQSMVLIGTDVAINHYAGKVRHNGASRNKYSTGAAKRKMKKAKTVKDRIQVFAEITRRYK